MRIDSAHRDRFYPNTLLYGAAQSIRVQLPDIRLSVESPSLCTSPRSSRYYCSEFWR